MYRHHAHGGLHFTATLSIGMSIRSVVVPAFVVLYMRHTLEAQDPGISTITFQYVSLPESGESAGAKLNMWR
jgi:hypothetical protein